LFEILKPCILTFYQLNDSDMAHLQNEIVSACTKNAQAIYDANGKANRDHLAVDGNCDTGASTPSLEQVTTSVSVTEPKEALGTENEQVPLETLKNDIDRSAHDLSTKIDEYNASGKHSVDDSLHVSYCL
jgi:hypothetical protein